MRRTLTLLLPLALLAATPATALKPAPEPTATTEAAPPPLTPEERAALFEAYDAAMKAGQKTQAADALLPIIDDDTKAAAHGEAWLKLGDLLTGFDMEYSALLAYGRAIEADPIIGAAKVKQAIDLADKLGDTRAIAPILARNVALDVDDDTKSRMAYLASRHNVQEGNFGVALGMLYLVKKDSSIKMEAEALRGVLLAQQGKYNEALAPLLTAQAMGREAERGERFDNVQTLNVARAYFGAGNFQRAVEYYAKVDRHSDFWPEAWFEKAWSHFRADDMNGSLSSLMVHESPFYEGFYSPEADMLRTYSYFFMCKFKDATKEIEIFEARYRPVHASLAETLATLTPQDAWAEGVSLTTGGTTRLPVGVIRAYRKDERFLGAISAVEKADDELSRLGNVSANLFASRAQKDLKFRRNKIIEQEGERIIKTATAARDELKGMLGNVQITKLDMMQYETSQLERASVTGTLEQGDRIGQLRKLRTRPDARVWPWQGEYWADEVGYYQVVARPDCPDSLRPRASN
jgi:tetratricopeptide (TPR) repeat protein